MSREAPAAESPVPSGNAAEAAALRYAEGFWPVFPLHSIVEGKCSCGKLDCAQPGKHPRVARGFKEATYDPAALKEWFQRWPSANLGIPTGVASGFVVLDVDPRPGGRESLLELEQEHGKLPDTVEATTGGGGRHFMFRTPNGVLKNSVGRVGDGLDIRGDGGYVVVAPSNHHSGGSYQWVKDRAPGNLPLADMPNWLLAKARRGSSIVQPRLENERRIPTGQRNSTLASIAMGFRWRGMGRDVIAVALQAINHSQCDPPLESTEVEQIAKSISRYDPSKPLPLTDLGNARRLAIRHGHDLQYCYPWNCWLIWDGQRWSRDDSGEVYRRAKDTVRGIYEEAHAAGDKVDAVAKHALRSQQRERIEALIRLAQSDLAITPDAIDRLPWLLNVENGTLDLRSGELQPHRRDDFLTKLAPVAFDPTALCPTWLRFLERIFCADDSLIQFIQRAVGYALTGDTQEQCLFLLHGTGANGKTTLLEAIRALMGDYARTADFATFLAKNHDAIRNDLAALKAARLVSASEVERGRRLNEPLVKQLTGGDRITARFLHAEFFEFAPQFKLFLAANHKPEIRGMDEGIWRRVRLIPFEVMIPTGQQDKSLGEKLLTELPGILNWLIAGCLAWQRRWLQPPDRVVAATSSYRD